MLHSFCLFLRILCDFPKKEPNTYQNIIEKEVKKESKKFGIRQNKRNAWKIGGNAKRDHHTPGRARTQQIRFPTGNSKRVDSIMILWRFRVILMIWGSLATFDGAGGGGWMWRIHVFSRMLPYYWHILPYANAFDVVTRRIPHETREMTRIH